MLDPPDLTTGVAVVLVTGGDVVVVVVGAGAVAVEAEAADGVGASSPARTDGVVVVVVAGLVVVDVLELVDDEELPEAEAEAAPGSS